MHHYPVTKQDALIRAFPVVSHDSGLRYNQSAKEWCYRCHQLRHRDQAFIECSIGSDLVCSMCTISIQGWLPESTSAKSDIPIAEFFIYKGINQTRSYRGFIFGKGFIYRLSAYARWIGSIDLFQVFAARGYRAFCDKAIDIGIQMKERIRII